MKEGLLLVERYVLEGLIKRPKNFEQMKSEMCLNEDLLRIVLDGLENRGIINRDKEGYSINLAQQREWASTINAQDNIFFEVVEVIDTFLDLHFEYGHLKGRGQKDSHFKLRKVWMTVEEKKILQGMLYNIERYLDKLQNGFASSRGEGRASQKEMVFWGHAPYDKVLESYIQGI